MKDSTPVHISLPKFVTLNGADTFFIMLERTNQIFSKGNNFLRMCISCKTADEAKKIEDKLMDSVVIHWMCNIELKNEKRVFFKPKWNYVDVGNKLEIKSYYLEKDEDALQAIINRPLLVKKDKLITCDRIIAASGEVTLVLSWHHALMDGRGSGHLLRSLFNDELTVQHFFPEREKEPNVYAYIRNMYKVKRFIQHSSRNPIGAIRKCSYKNKDKETSINFFSHTFSDEETNAIDANAISAGSKFGSNNFLLACCAVAVHQLQKDKGVPGDLWIPVPYDGRKRGGIGPVISNQIAFLFYRLSPKDLKTVSDCVRSIHVQMMEQMKMDMPKKYDQLLGMLRYIPLSLYNYITTRSSQGKVASFLFSSAGQDKWDLANLTNHHIQSIQMIPPATVPPGLTFNFLRNENCLTLNLLWSSELLDNQEFEELKQVLMKLMKT